MLLIKNVVIMSTVSLLCPFTLADNYEINNINNSDNMHFCEGLPILEEIYETNHFTIEATLPSNVSSKYYSVLLIFKNRKFRKI